MPTSPKALIAWSSGKYSAWALHEARLAGDLEIVGALITVADTFHRVSMHGVREELLRAQFDAAGLRPLIIHIPYPCPNENGRGHCCRASIRSGPHDLRRLVLGGCTGLPRTPAFRHRDRAGVSIMGPGDAALADAMIDAGTEAHICTVDLKKLPVSFAGRRFDRVLLEAPCGENGEFHSFVSGGPMLSRKVAV